MRPRAILQRLGLALGFVMATAGAAAQVDEAAAERLMRSSGLWDQLGSTAAGARAGIEAAAKNQLTPLNADEVQRLLQATDAAFAADTLRPATRKALAVRLAPEHVRALDGWLDSDFGRRITAMEVAASKPDRDSDRVIRSGVRRLAEASEARRRLIENLVEASRAAESITNMTINIAIAVQRGMSGVRPDLPAPPIATLRENFAAERPQMLQAYQGMSQALFAEMYAGLSDAEVTSYLDFLRGTAGKQFLEASMQAVEQALVQAAERLGARLPGTRPGAQT
jgi:phytoene dehydrogenase-like protein